MARLASTASGNCRMSPQAPQTAWWCASSPSLLIELPENMDRDKRTRQALEDAGWLLIVVWEHEDVSLAVHRIVKSVRTRRGFTALEG
ncbi:hypothetical protein [Verrucosispora sp. FIM060022]|uniref:hypothetical protein n=1 Tax=Verrucosispora sp. FIM060022 TaxID=1479020 RepID=UPI000F88E651|nr:hypothetical protein [Verrucosispora sp. FIM060022]RUL89905.1 hypothetical protein EG812_28425 [Verrucosispora sp. FIM060022]